MRLVRLLRLIVVRAADFLGHVLMTGHVFHEDCLQQWFRAQTAAYKVRAREQGDREDSPDIFEIPVECPTCRTECLADDEDGEPILHRLYINLSGDGSQRGSSPIPGSQRTPKGKERETQLDREVMSLARRARGLGEEVKDLSVKSSSEEVDGTLKRVEGLREDVVSIKAIQGVRVSQILELG